MENTNTTLWSARCAKNTACIAGAGFLAWSVLALIGWQWENITYAGAQVFQALAWLTSAGGFWHTQALLMTGAVCAVYCMCLGWANKSDGQTLIGDLLAALVLVFTIVAAVLYSDTLLPPIPETCHTFRPVTMFNVQTICDYTYAFTHIFAMAILFVITAGAWFVNAMRRTR